MFDGILWIIQLTITSDNGFGDFCKQKKYALRREILFQENISNF